MAVRVLPYSMVMPPAQKVRNLRREGGVLGGNGGMVEVKKVRDEMG